MALSLDVIFHLVEVNVFDEYMTNLFASSHNLVIIYSSNDDSLTDPAPHVRHRRFTDWIDENQPSFEQVDMVHNPYAWDEDDRQNTSFSDFYVYRKYLKPTRRSSLL